MRTLGLLTLVATLAPGCGDNDVVVPPESEPPPPRVIAGGGVGDGPIDGIAYVYVIDERTRTPISGVAVQVGTIRGSTDADGLFVAEGVTGPQTVLLRAPGVSEMWVGVNGTNMTFNVTAPPSPFPTTVHGAVDMSSITVPPNHLKRAYLTYSHTHDPSDPQNMILQNQHEVSCTADGDDLCRFGVRTRRGTVGLLATLYDYDPILGSFRQIGFALGRRLDTSSGAPLSGHVLTPLGPGTTTNVTVDFGSPPSGLSNVLQATIGIDGGADGIFVVGANRPGDETFVPTPGALGSPGYRLVGVARTGVYETASESMVVRYGLTGSTLSAGAWLDPPTTNTSAVRTAAAWGAVPGATIYTIQFEQSLEVTVLDGSTSIDIPDLVALPGGYHQMRVDFRAIGAPDLDVTNFSLDAERHKLSQISTQPVAIVIN